MQITLGLSVPSPSGASHLLVKAHELNQYSAGQLSSFPYLMMPSLVGLPGMWQSPDLLGKGCNTQIPCVEEKVVFSLWFHISFFHLFLLMLSAGLWFHLSSPQFPSVVEEVGVLLPGSGPPYTLSLVTFPPPQTLTLVTCVYPASLPL